MRAVYKTRREPGAIEVREVDEPRPGPEDLLIRVQAGSICGSDVHVYRYSHGFEYIQPPFILGHEFTGVVEACGERVKEFRVGDRVVSEGVHYCGECPACRTGHTNQCRRFRIIGLHFDGGFAEYACFPARYAHRIPKAVPPEWAALVEPASVAVHAVRRGPELLASSAVVVTGVGPIGLMVAQVARRSGAGQVLVTGLDADEEKRLPIARELGLQVINVERQDLGQAVKDLADGYGADVVFECSGSSRALLQALDLVRKGGQVILVGIQSQTTEVYFTPLIRREISIHSAFCSTWVDFEAAIGMLSRRELSVGPLITTFALDKAEEALEASFNRQVGKAVLMP